MRKLFIGCIPFLLSVPSLAHAAPAAWQVSEATGDVRLTQNGQSRAAVRGALLASGATITTGPSARAVIVRGGEFVVVSPRTQLRVPADDRPNTVTQMIEDFGTAVFKIAKKATPHFGVQTPYLAAVVKGTTFTVTVGPEGGSVQVTEGAVEVATLDGGAVDLVEPGEIASVGASDLYQLTVEEGDSTKVVRSEDAPPAGTVTTTSALSPVAAYQGPLTQPTRIGEPIGEEPQSLRDVTDGLLDGSAAVEVAMVQTIDPPRGDGPGAPAPGQGSSSPNAGDDDQPASGDPGTGNGGTGGGEDQSGDGKPADSGKPGDTGKPDDMGKPDDTGNPGSGPPEEVPSNGGDDPAKGGDNPGNGPPEEVPANGGDNPGRGSDNPGNGQPEEVPDNGAESPGNGGDTPGNGDDNPGNGPPQVVPGNGGDNPGNGPPDEAPGNGAGDDADNSGPGNGNGNGNGGDEEVDSSGPGNSGDNPGRSVGDGNSGRGSGGDDAVCVLGLACVDPGLDDGR